MVTTLELEAAQQLSQDSHCGNPTFLSTSRPGCLRITGKPIAQPGGVQIAALQAFKDVFMSALSNDLWWKAVLVTSDLSRWGFYHEVHHSWAYRITHNYATKPFLAFTLA